MLHLVLSCPSSVTKCFLGSVLPLYLTSVCLSVVTHNKLILFQIFFKKNLEYTKSYELNTRIYSVYKVCESNIRIYSVISKSRIEYANIFVWSKLNIRIRILDIRRTIFEYPNIFEYSSFTGSVGRILKF